jgi:hypothetical protein
MSDFADMFFAQLNATADRLQRTRAQGMQEEYMQAQIDQMKKSTEMIPVDDLPEQLRGFFKGRGAVPFHQIQPLVASATGAVQAEALGEMRAYELEQKTNLRDRSVHDEELKKLIPALEALRPTGTTATDMGHPGFWNKTFTGLGLADAHTPMRDLRSRQENAMVLLDQVRDNLQRKNTNGRPLPPSEATRMYVSSAVSASEALLEQHDNESAMSQILRRRINELRQYVGAYTFDEMTTMAQKLQGRLTEIEAKEKAQAANK